jgi:hypothetical protein
LLFNRGLRGEGFQGVAAMTVKDAQQITNSLIQGYIGPDNRVIDMPSFYNALVELLQAAHQQGWKDRAEADALLTEH